MSNVIKINSKSGGVKIKVNAEFDSDLLNPDGEEDTLQKQLQIHYDKGYQEAYKNTKAELEKEFTKKLVECSEEFKRILSSLEVNLKDYEQSFDKIVIEVAVAISEKIVKREIDKKTIVVDSLRASIKKILGANEIKIKINPQDYEVIAADGNNQILGESFSKIKFEQDETLEKGGCLVETEIGNVDSRITSQLLEIRKQLESNFSNEIL